MSTLENYKVALVDVQAICDTEHYWQPGVYIRKMLGRAHHIFIGAEHKEVHTNIIVSGSFDLSVNGGPIQRLQAPVIFTSNIGDQKTAYFHTDTVWLNIMSNADNETDVDILDKRYVIKDTENIRNMVSKLRVLEQETHGGDLCLGL
jgi:hypothetical protein